MNEFNPHWNRTSDGTMVTIGLSVIDYDRREGVVTGDTDGGSYNCQMGACGRDHWFEVTHSDGTVGRFNGERMQSFRKGISQ